MTERSELTFDLSWLSADQHNNLAHPVTSAIGGGQGEWMSSSPLNQDHPVGSKRPCTQSETQHVEGGIVESSEIINQNQQAVEGSGAHFRFN